VSGLLLQACGGGQSQKPVSPEGAAGSAATEKEKPSDYDPKRGEGTYNATNVSLAALDEAKAKAGEGVANTKCASCHKLTDEKLVGPGWKGVTTRREPFWILNFITNPDPMIDKDPVVQAQLELCLVRMPNQSLTDGEAREILEFMRKNDGVK
jgi:mono/diheme cytochrome c family protein